MDNRTARARLDAAVRERDALRTSLGSAEGALRGAMRDAYAQGLTLAEIGELTGYHRNTVRAIVTAGDAH